MGKNRDTVTVKDAEGKEVDIGVYDVLGQLDIKDILWHLDPDDFLNEIGVQDAINCFGEETVFDRVATPEMAVDRLDKHTLIDEIGYTEALKWIGDDDILDYLKTKYTRVGLMGLVLDLIKESYPEK